MWRNTKVGSFGGRRREGICNQHLMGTLDDPSFGVKSHGAVCNGVLLTKTQMNIIVLKHRRLKTGFILQPGCQCRLKSQWIGLKQSYTSVCSLP